MIQQRIPFITPEMFRDLPDQTTEILNRLITEVNDNQTKLTEISNTLIVLRQMIAEMPQPTPPTPTGEWQQVLNFVLANMGTVQGECLKNTRLGFGIQTGTYLTARADMESQIANSTLHAGIPPADIAVPIYYSNFNIVAAGHVAVWDHGTVYSDGVYYPSIDAVTSNYTGWGELCDGVRVVSPAN